MATNKWNIHTSEFTEFIPLLFCCFGLMYLATATKKNVNVIWINGPVNQSTKPVRKTKTKKKIWNELQNTEQQTEQFSNIK